MDSKLSNRPGGTWNEARNGQEIEMQTLVKTNAAAMSEGEVIRTRAGDGLSWVIVTCKSWDGSVHYMVCLCAERHETHGRKKVHYYEWLGYRDWGKSFENRDAAVAYIASQD